MRFSAMPATEAPAPPADAPDATAGGQSSAATSVQPAYVHLPVLLQEVLELAPEGAELLVDATLGGGGHAEGLLARFPRAELFGCDRDADAVEAARQRLAPAADRTMLKQMPFSELHRHLLLDSVDFLLADLGVSSPQLERAERGFSFSQDGPLDMRMDPSSDAATAADLVNGGRRERLLEIFFRLGEERFAPRIVAAILKAREGEPIATTGRLAELVAGAVPRRYHRKGHHPATKAFQALRMAVNDEAGQLELLLDGALPLLRPGGRVAVISFHSLEDRQVKQRFRLWEQPCQCPPQLPRCVCGKQSLGKRLTRKPLLPGAAEAGRNPRARSAKLRAFEKK